MLKGLVARLVDPTLFKEVGITYSGHLATSGIGFVIQILLQRVLGPGGYGILSIATSVGTLSAVLTDAGLSSAMIRYGGRYLSEAPEKAMPRFRAALLLRLALTLLVTLAGLLLAHWLALDVFEMPALEAPITWAYAGLIGGVLWGFWLFFIQAHQRFVLRSAVSVSAALLRLGAFGLLWLTAMLSPTSMIILDACIGAVGFLIGMRFSPRGLFRLDTSELLIAGRELVPYCRFTGTLMLAQAVFTEVDTFMLGIFTEEEVVGVYRAAWTYAMALGFLNLSVANVLFPKITAIADVGEMRAYLRRSLRFTSVLALSTLPAVPLVVWWIPWYAPSYADATTIFLLMYAGLVVELAIGPVMFVPFSLDRPGPLITVEIVKIVLNVGGNLVLIPVYGALGAAAATLMTRLIGAGLAVWVVRRQLEGYGKAAEG